MAQRARILLLALALALPACFRPAGEAIEPTQNTGRSPGVPTETTGSLPPAAEGTDDLAADEAQGADPSPTFNLSSVDEDDLATFPPITVVQPTRLPIATGTDPAEAEDAGSTPAFITPGVPLGLIDEPTATPPGGAFTATPSGLITPTGMLAQGEDACTYIVQPNDSLYAISTRYGLTVDDMRAANPDLVGDPPILQPGQALNVPGCGENASSDAQVAATALPVNTVEGGQVYIVEAGDTVMRIAQRFGVTIEDIAAANNLQNPNRLDIGQQLIIPPPSG